MIESFSKRRTEIAEVLAESGNTSARAAQIATLGDPQAQGLPGRPRHPLRAVAHRGDDRRLRPGEAGRCLLQTAANRAAHRP